MGRSEDKSGELWSIGEYLITGHLADGGMGRVYAAWHPGLDRVLALKLPKPGFVASQEGLLEFRNEVQTLAVLEHPHITRVYSGGIQDGQPYLAMELLEGGSLEEEDCRRRYQTPEAALHLVLKLARAVQYAQERQVLHCDIKPSNILFDDSGEPRISDYGLALRLDRANTEGARRGGTRGWMAPEQLPAADATECAAKPLTTAADVFGLGMLLQWLLTDTLPFGVGGDFPERVRSQRRVPPGRWSPSRRWATRAIIYRALQADHTARYASAAQLAADLKRAIAGRPLRAYPTPLRGRLWLWAGRYPIAAITACLVFLLLVLGGVLGELASAKHEMALREGVLEMNAYAARGQAASVLYSLREHREALLRTAEVPLLGELAQTVSPTPAPRLLLRFAPAWDEEQNPCAAQTELSPSALLRDYAGGFDALQILSIQGCLRARFPEPPGDYVMRTFDWRDYFRGAAHFGQTGESAVHVGSVFRSTITNEIRFSLSTPLFRPVLPPLLPGKRWVGVITAGITVAGAFALPSVGVQTSDRITALLGPFEGESKPARPAPPADYMFLAHPALKRGAEQLAASVHSSRLRSAFGAAPFGADAFILGDASPYSLDGYIDPFLGGQWLAAFAPVGSTGYVVLVQTRLEAAIRPSSALTRLLVYVFAALSLLALVGFGAFALWEMRASGEDAEA